MNEDSTKLQFSCKLNWKLLYLPKTFSVYIFTNPSAYVECDTRLIFKQSLTGLNSEFSFS